MATITTRSGKGSALTHTELDNNFTNLNTDKVEASGDTITGNLDFNDNVKARFGAGQDLEIYHDGSNSIIADQGTGTLNLKGSAAVYVQATGTDEYMAAFSKDGPVQLYYDSAVKFSTTSTGIDVTGTVTADGLTVEKDNESMSTFYRPNSSEAAAFNVNFDFNTANGTQATFAQLRADNDGNANGSQDGALSIRTAKSGSLLTRFKADENGDISFYEDTGTTAKLFWDASAERLGIGTSSPQGALSVSNGGAEGIEIDYTGGTMRIVSFDRNAVTDSSLEYRASEHVFKVSTSEKMRIDSSGNVGIGTDSPTTNLDIAAASSTTLTVRNTSTVSSILLANGSSANQIFSRGANSSTGRDLAFVQGTSEKMRIDSSGNVLVGKTSALSLTTAGHELHADGLSVSTRDSDVVTILNRETNDGSILQFRKDNTVVGSIGTSNSGTDLVIDANRFSNRAGLRFRDSALFPRQNSADINGAIDLGGNGAAFKDLYLSGGVYLGGTAAANKLDDYEEGTFTPSFNGGDYTFTYNKQKGSYTKIGNRVFVDMILNIDTSTAPSGTTDGDLSVTGLPFTFNAQNTVDVLAVSIGFKQQIANAEDSLSVRLQSGNTEFKIHKDLATGFPDGSLLQASDLVANSRLRIQFSYPTNS